MIGAGPAGLTYASLVADGNEVTVFEKRGGRRRRVPLRRQGAAVPGGRGQRASFARYIADSCAACDRKGVELRFDIDVTAQPELLAPFDRIVIATGARLSVRPRPARQEHARAGRRPLAGAVARMLSAPALRDWFYYRARRGTAERFRRLAKPGQKVDRDRRRRAGRQEQAGDRQRLRGGAAGWCVDPGSIGATRSVVAHSVQDCDGE